MSSRRAFLAALVSAAAPAVLAAPDLFRRRGPIGRRLPRLPFPRRRRRRRVDDTQPVAAVATPVA